MSPTAARYAVFGHPIAHSLSPAIHAQFAAQSGLDLDYRAIDAPPETFAAQLAEFAAAGGAGANVTLPLKGRAFELCAELSDAARQAGVVNTLTRLPDGRFHGDNTDGRGLVRDLTERQRLDLRGREVLLLGAGGAAQGIIGALLDARIYRLTLCNRTPARAEALADRIGDPARVTTRYWADLDSIGSFDLIINATSAGHGEVGMELPFSLTGARALCYDLSYGKAARAFLAWARAANAAWALDGLGMLVEQAALAFELWHGVRPDSETVYQALRAQLDA